MRYMLENRPAGYSEQCEGRQADVIASAQERCTTGTVRWIVWEVSYKRVAEVTRDGGIEWQEGFEPETAESCRRRGCNPKASTLVPGDTVKIYYDPYTQERLEGTATLVAWEFTESGFPTVEWWGVRFDQGKEVFSRCFLI